MYRHPFARIFSIWNSFFKAGMKEGEELIEKYSIRRYIRSKERLINAPLGFFIQLTECVIGFVEPRVSVWAVQKPPVGYIISFKEFCLFISEDATARADPLFKPLTGKLPKPKNRIKRRLRKLIKRTFCLNRTYLTVAWLILLLDSGTNIFRKIVSPLRKRILLVGKFGPLLPNV